MGKVILITGASSGFGLQTAKVLAQAGHVVYASIRDLAGRNAKAGDEILDWSKQHGTDLRTIELDVQDGGRPRRRSLRCSPTRACWTLLSTTPGTWSTDPPRRSHPSSYWNNMTSM